MIALGMKTWQMRLLQMAKDSNSFQETHNKLGWVATLMSIVFFECGFFFIAAMTGCFRTTGGSWAVGIAMGIAPLIIIRLTENIQKCGLK